MNVEFLIAEEDIQLGGNAQSDNILCVAEAQLNPSLLLISIHNLHELWCFSITLSDNIFSESPLPPTSFTSIPSDTSISLMWSHSDECFENCTFMYEVTWQQSGDGSSLKNITTNEKFCTIEGLTPGTS